MGAYAMSVTLLHASGGTGSPPAVDSSCHVPGATKHRYPTGPVRAQQHPCHRNLAGTDQSDTVSGVNISSASDLDYFKFQTASSGAYQVTAQGMLVQVFTARGRLHRRRSEPPEPASTPHRNDLPGENPAPHGRGGSGL